MKKLGCRESATVDKLLSFLIFLLSLEMKMLLNESPQDCFISMSDIESAV